MERKFSNGAAAAAEQQAATAAGRRVRTNSTTTATGDKKGACAAEDCSQLDNIIGGWGKYQLMIFMFKILIGLVVV